MRILFLMADGFEETEAVTPFDYFQRAGMEVTLASISENLEVVGAHGLKIKAEACLKDVVFSDYDGVLLPGGGPGVRNLSASGLVLEAVREFDRGGKWVLAICAAPLVLSRSGILENRRVTCYPGCESELVCKEFLMDRVVVDSRIITSRGAGTAEEFALACIAKLVSPDVSEKVRQQIVAR